MGADRRPQQSRAPQPHEEVLHLQEPSKHPCVGAIGDMLRRLGNDTGYRGGYSGPAGPALPDDLVVRLFGQTEAQKRRDFELRRRGEAHYVAGIGHICKLVRGTVCFYAWHLRETRCLRHRVPVRPVGRNSNVQNWPRRSQAAGAAGGRTLLTEVVRRPVRSKRSSPYERRRRPKRRVVRLPNRCERGSRSRFGRLDLSAAGLGGRGRYTPRPKTGRDQLVANGACIHNRRSGGS